MTYLAPRQGLFAIIILISFLIHTTLLIISTDQQVDALKKQTAEHMLVQLIDEVKLPLISKDKVSLSVLAGRYTSESQVASVTVRDIDGDVLLQAGQAQLLKGDQISKAVLMGDNQIGNVTLTLRDTSKREIIASQWLYILGSFIVHLLLWLIYGYIARPTREQLAALSRDIQDHLIEQRGARFYERRNRLSEEEESDGYDRDDYGYKNEHDHDDSEDVEDNQTNVKPLPTSNGLNVHQAVNQYVQAHQSDEGVKHQGNDYADNSTEHTGVTAATRRDAERNMAGSIDQDQEGSQYNTANLDSHSSGSDDISTSRHVDMQQGASVPYPRKDLVSDRPIEVAAVQIRFHDPSKLIATLAIEQSKPYFALCTQLLQRTLDELLKQPLLYGVKLNNTPTFNADGATVEFVNSGRLSKSALAAVMLAKVYVMLNQVTYIKHRELQRFALEVYAGVSDEAVADKMVNLIRQRAEANEIFTLLPIEGIKQLSGHVQLENLSHPTTVYERDCSLVKGTSDAMMQRLVEVRNAVLLSAQR